MNKSTMAIAAIAIFVSLGIARRDSPEEYLHIAVIQSLQSDIDLY